MAQSLTRIYLQVLLILLLCIGAAGYAGYLLVHDVLLASYQESAAQTSRVAADHINDQLSEHKKTLEVMARQPGIVSLLQRGTPAERERKQDELKSMLPGAVMAYLLPRNSAGDLSSTETLDPACLDFIRRASAAGKPPTPEFHEIGAAVEHYDMATAVRDESQKPVGYLLVKFSSEPLRSVIEQALPPGGHMQLQQALAGRPAQTVMEVGEAASADTASVTNALGNNTWTLTYQSGETPRAILRGNRIYYAASILLAFTIMIIVLFRLYRRTLNAVRHDIRSLIRMFRDLREGSVRVDYPMALREFLEIFDYLRDRGQKLVEEKEKLKDMGLMDHLSQLGNRRHFEERLKELFESSKANGPSSVLMIDMDYFKKVNDVHGHDAGDALIVGFANALRKVVRQTDVLVRLGGDEFCIIYSYAPLAKATALVERLRKQLPREIPLTKGVIHRLRWTGGLSSMHDKDTKPDDVLWRADQALLQAKEAGRNLTKVYDPASGPPVKKKILVG
jgi:diguanylate cyclase (GGDEF)-like protein